MTRRIPRRMLPHRDAAKIRPVSGVNAHGLQVSETFTLKRSQVAIGVALRGGQYEKENGVIGVIYTDRAEFATIPTPGSTVTAWPGTANEQESKLRRTEFYSDPQIGDLVVFVLE